MTDALGYFVVTHPEPVGDLTDWPPGWPLPGTVGDFAERCGCPSELVSPDRLEAGDRPPEVPEDDEGRWIRTEQGRVYRMFDPATGELRLATGDCGCVEESLPIVARAPAWRPFGRSAEGEAAENEGRVVIYSDTRLQDP